MIKQDLLSRGVNLSGPCGAFEITKRVAWQLRAEGAGLLSKPAGNNCEGYATDYIVFRNGPSFDILGDGGGANNPQWAQDDDPSLLARWRDPLPVDEPAPIAEVPVVEIAPVVPDQVLDLLLQIHAQQDSDREKVLAEVRGLRQDVTDALKHYGPALLGPLAGLFKKR
jgi:hypothetical protein